MKTESQFPIFSSSLPFPSACAYKQVQRPIQALENKKTPIRQEEIKMNTNTKENKNNNTAELDLNEMDQVAAGRTPAVFLSIFQKTINKLFGKD